MAKTIYGKDPVKFIPALAVALKEMEEFETPEWALFVKSGTSRDRPPADEDFWYTRAASILRQLYIRGVVGVGKLRNRYGSKKDRGGKPDHFRKAGGKIIRVILQQAEAAGLVEKLARLQFGRRLTAKGRELLDSIEVEEKKGLDFESVKVVEPTGTAEEIVETPAEEVSAEVEEETAEEAKEEEKAVEKESEEIIDGE